MKTEWQIFEEQKDPFSEKWERDGHWLLGRTILSTIIEYLKGKSVIAEFDDDDRKECITVSLPLPEIRDEISGEMRSIYWMVPE